MKKILILTLVTVLGLFTAGCVDSSSSNNGGGNDTANNSYTTQWQVYLGTGNNYTTQYSVTSKPFPSISYSLNNGSQDGPVNPSATRNYYGEAERAQRPFLTHWRTGEDSLTLYPYEDVDYVMSTSQNTGVSSTSNYRTYIIWEGTANGNESDFQLDTSYVPPDNDGAPTDDNPSDGDGDGTDNTGDGTDNGNSDNNTGDETNTDNTGNSSNQPNRRN